jgi:hypothetical protein
VAGEEDTDVDDDASGTSGYAEDPVCGGWPTPGWATDDDGAGGGPEVVAARCTSCT